MLPDRQKLRITELPEGYRLVGIESDSFVVCDPSGRKVLMQQHGHLVGVTTRSTPRSAGHPDRLGAESAVTGYRNPMD